LEAIPGFWLGGVVGSIEHTFRKPLHDLLIATADNAKSRLSAIFCLPVASEGVKTMQVPLQKIA